MPRLHSTFHLLSVAICLLTVATVTPQANAAVTKVAAGEFHSLYVTDDGTLWGMGDNELGQLGDGASMVQNTPVQVATGVIAAAAGYEHSLFVKNDNTLWAMGWDGCGQLGDGTFTFSFRGKPVQVATGVVAVAARSDYSLFVKGDGTLWGMGYINLDKIKGT